MQSSIMREKEGDGRVANIDNTVLFEVLARLYGVERTPAGRYAGGGQGIIARDLHIYNSKLQTYFAHGEYGQRGTQERVAFWVGQDRWQNDIRNIISEDFLNQMNQKANGQPMENSDHPEEWSFESQVYQTMFNVQNQPGWSPEKLKETILSVCREYQVERQYLDVIQQETDLSPMIKYMIGEAQKAARNKKQTAEHALTQKTEQTAAAVSVASPKGADEIGVSFSVEEIPGWQMSESDHADDTFRSLDGCCLASDFPAFLHWGPAANEQILNDDCYGTLEFPDGSYQDIPYLEVLGSEEDGQWEFVQGENFDCRCTDGSFDMSSYIGDGAAEGLAAEKKLAARLRWGDRGPSMWLENLWLQTGDNGGKLVLGVGKGDYRGQRVYRTRMLSSLLEQDDFLRTMKGIRGEPERLGGKPWANCGGGCWITAQSEDGKEYLIVSYRNPKRVAEEPGILGYSSSGSYEYRDGTFAGAMCREIREELGIPVPKPEELRMVSLGVDTERYLIQASFVWRTKYPLSRINRFRKNQATTGGEQYIFYVPFEPETCYGLLSRAAFEPGAAYSLMRILQKYT